MHQPVKVLVVMATIASIYSQFGWLKREIIRSVKALLFHPSFNGAKVQFGTILEKRIKLCKPTVRNYCYCCCWCWCQDDCIYRRPASCWESIAACISSWTEDGVEIAASCIISQSMSLFLKLVWNYRNKHSNNKPYYNSFILAYKTTSDSRLFCLIYITVPRTHPITTTLFPEG